MSEHKIKLFLTPEQARASEYYFHQFVALAEGFRMLQVPCYGNINYWQEPGGERPLIQEAPAGYQATINVFHTCFFDQHPENFDLVRPGSFNILLDNNDGVGMACYSPQNRRFDAILRTHYSAHQRYPSNVLPWAFGLTGRIITTLYQTAGQSVQDRVLINFRWDHNIRRLALRELKPVLARKYEIYENVDEQAAREDEYYADLTLGRHHRAYFEALNVSRLTFCFGGNFILEMPYDKNLSAAIYRRYLAGREKFLKLWSGGVKSYDENLQFWRTHDHYYVNQFDSWRWWEALASHTVPLHLDFEDHGFLLPEMPENGRHYYGVRQLNFESSGEELLNLSADKLEGIAAEGQKWCLEHYAPEPTARRLIAIASK